MWDNLFPIIIKICIGRTNLYSTDWPNRIITNTFKFDNITSVHWVNCAHSYLVNTFCTVLGICANRVSLLFRARRPTQTSVSDRYVYTSQQAVRWKSHLKICSSPCTTPCLTQQAACIHLLRRSMSGFSVFCTSRVMSPIIIFSCRGRGLPICRYAILFSQSRGLMMGWKFLLAARTGHTVMLDKRRL
jgi:hypothetical protein